MVSASFLLAATAASSARGVTVDDLVCRTLVASFSISPDGKMVTFLTLQADPRQDQYVVTLYFENTKAPLNLHALARYRLAPEKVYDATTHALYRTVSQYVWSHDSKKLLYSTHVGSGMEIRVKTIGTTSERVVLRGHEGLQIQENIHNGHGWRIISFDHYKHK
jgi:hypothetical protein